MRAHRTQAEVDAGGPISTSVTADSAEPPGHRLGGRPGDPGPAIDVVASTTTASVGAGGQVVHYTFTVTNAGNQTLTGVSLTDPDCDPPPWSTWREMRTRWQPAADRDLDLHV